MITLTPRLRCIAELVPACRCAADIGTDHAYVPLYLLAQKKIRRAVASDIHEGPARRAEENCRKEGVEGLVSVRVGAGLSTLRPGEAEGAVIAGMGGLMIRTIIQEGAAIAAGLKWFVLQPQNHADMLRKWLIENEYAIEAEVLAAEEGKIYEILLVRHGKMDVPSAAELTAGLWKYRKNDPLFPEFLQRLIRKCGYTLNGIAADTTNAVNAEKRKQAEKRKKELEEIVWRLKQET